MLNHEPERIEIPDELSDVVDQGLRKARILHRKKVWKKVMVSCTSAAAVIALLFIIGLQNPTLAEKLPLIGNIFKKTQTSVSYKGEYSQDATRLVEGDGEENPYIQTSGGITVTVSEIYYSSQALYLGVSIENEEEFPAEMNCIESMEDYILDYQQLNLMGNGRAVWDGGSCEDLWSYSIEGVFQDSHTFVGIIRIDTGNITYWPSQEEIEAAGISSAAVEEEGLTDEEGYRRADEYNRQVLQTFPDAGEKIILPDEFTYEFSLEEIRDFRSDQSYEGEWKFTFDVSVDDSKTQAAEVNETNEQGIGIGSVKRTPYEITADVLLPQGEPSYDYFLVMCDANGDLLDYQGSSTDVYSTYNRDTDTIFVFVCDAVEYLDKLKGYYWSEDYPAKREEKTFAQYLSEHALYGTEVSFLES